tara:strand:- start:534 stop:665 length:132 start_codon:yes stop_codon:yes gene_type:complete
MYDQKKKPGAEDLQQYFDQFHEILDANGLPTIYNGKRLLPWKE